MTFVKRWRLSVHRVLCFPMHAAIALIRIPLLGLEDLATAIKL